jgi:hypothetical protein
MDLGNKIHTGGSGGRGDLGGEIFGVKVLRSSGNSSSEFSLAVARSVWHRLCDLEIRGRRNRVRGVHESKGKRVVQRREAGAHCNGGVLGDQWRHSGLISAAWRRFLARVLGGASAAEGGFYRCDSLDEGQRNRSEFGGDSMEIFQVLDVFVLDSSNGMTGGALCQ